MLKKLSMIDGWNNSKVIRIWDSGKWMGDEIIVQGRLSFSLLRAGLRSMQVTYMPDSLQYRERLEYWPKV